MIKRFLECILNKKGTNKYHKRSLSVKRLPLETRAHDAVAPREVNSKGEKMMREMREYIYEEEANSIKVAWATVSNGDTDDAVRCVFRCCQKLENIFTHIQSREKSPKMLCVLVSQRKRDPGRRFDHGNEQKDTSKNVKFIYTHYSRRKKHCFFCARQKQSKNVYWSLLCFFEFTIF